MDRGTQQQQSCWLGTELKLDQNEVLCPRSNLSASCSEIGTPFSATASRSLTDRSRSVASRRVVARSLSDVCAAGTPSVPSALAASSVNRCIVSVAGLLCELRTAARTPRPVKNRSSCRRMSANPWLEPPLNLTPGFSQQAILAHSRDRTQGGNLGSN